MIRRFFETVYRICYYGWTLRHSYEFDYSYCEQVFLLKLKNLQHAMNTCEFHMNLENLYAIYNTPEDQFPANTLECIKAYRALNVVIKLLERQQKSDWYGEFTGVYHFIQNYTHDERDNWFNVAKEDAEILTKKEYSRRLLTLHEKESRMVERDKRNAYLLISQYSNFWWI